MWGREVSAGEGRHHQWRTKADKRAGGPARVEKDLSAAVSPPGASEGSRRRGGRLSFLSRGERERRVGVTHTAETQVKSPAEGSLGLDTEEGISFHTLLG